MSVCSAASPLQHVGDFLLPPHLRQSMCQQTWFDGYDLTSYGGGVLRHNFCFCFFDEAVISLLPSVGPSPDAEPSSLASHIFWGILFMSPFFWLPGQTLPPSSTLHSSSLVHTDLYEPTNPRPSGSGWVWPEFVYLYLWILPSEATLSCLPPSTEGQSSVPGGPLFPHSRNCLYFSPFLWLRMVIA